MLFKRSYSVPANTTAQSPSWQKLQLSKGHITGWIVFMREEAADCLKLRVEYHGSQVYPFTGSEWIYGFFRPVLIPDQTPIDEAPYILDIFAINSASNKAHEYHVFVVVEPEKIEQPAVPLYQVIGERVKELFGME